MSKEVPGPLPSAKEFETLLLDEDLNLDRQPEATQKALEFLWSISKFAPDGGSIDLNVSALELLDLGIIPAEVAERVKEEDANNLRIFPDPENKNIVYIVEEYTRRREYPIRFIEKDLPSSLLLDQRMRKTFQLEKTDEDRIAIKMKEFSSPQSHLHLLLADNKNETDELREINGIPFDHLFQRSFSSQEITAPDINRLLTTCYRGLGGRIS